MPVNLRGRHYLKLLDYTPAEIRYLLELSKDFKRMKRAGTPHRYLAGKHIVLLFEKTSTRTRCSFEVAARDPGGGRHLSGSRQQPDGQEESIGDTARVLGRIFDGIEYRGFDQKTVEDLANYAGVPVWNGLTDADHPTQILADLLTIEEHFGYKQPGHSRSPTWATPGTTWATPHGPVRQDGPALHRLALPRSCSPLEELVEECRKIAAETGGHHSPDRRRQRSTKDADVLYTDIWVSMGEPDPGVPGQPAEALPGQ